MPPITRDAHLGFANDLLSAADKLAANRDYDHIGALAALARAHLAAASHETTAALAGQLTIIARALSGRTPG